MNNEVLETGGYLSLEQNDVPNNQFWEKCLLMNSAKNCFNIIIKEINVKKIYIPRYTCEVMHKLKYENTSIQFYNINNLFLVEDNIKLNKDEVIIYTNYFGVNDESCKQTINRFGKEKVIIDNAQSLFTYFDCLANVYSPRKFFGIPDGGIIKSDYIDLDIKLPVETTSVWGFTHLLLRRDKRTKLGLEWHQKNEKRILNLKPKLMSIITSSLLKKIDIEVIINKRNKNFKFLDTKLKHINRLDVSVDSTSPVCYPILIDENLRSHLHANNIYTPHYWKNNSNLNSFENKISNMTSFLPIDQNINEEKLLHIRDIIESYE